jgi:trehalose 6-phosphate phosphatase
VTADSLAGRLGAAARHLPPQPALPPTAELALRLSHSPLLVALDIDGTLAPIAPTPQAAAVPDETRHVLERLAGLPHVHVAFVTGRAVLDGRRIVSVARGWTIGNHGMELIAPDGALRVNTSVESFAPTIARAAERLEPLIGSIPGVIIENKKWTLSIHVRLAARADVPRVERVLMELARELDLRIVRGKEIYELRPPIGIHKGTALIELASNLGVLDGSGALVGSLLYAGDDLTDEDAFRALRALNGSAVTVHVGATERPALATEAEFIVGDPHAVAELLQWLLSTRDA